MEGLTRLVTESLARHGFDRPLDYRRLNWSRWFRCDSHHSLLFVPSKPGVFALAEEITHVATPTSAVPRSEASAAASLVWDRISDPVKPSAPRQDLATNREGHDCSPAGNTPRAPAALAAEGTADGNNRAEAVRRMLAVTQFFEDDDMAFVLDRMLSRHNLMSSRLTSGRYFVRFVVIDDQAQRRSICAALNQWIVTAAEKATGIGSHFASSLELTPATEYIPQANDAQPSLFEAKKADAIDAHVGRTLLSANADTTHAHVGTDAFLRPASEASSSRTKPGSAATLSTTAPQLDSGAATNLHCPAPLPSGF